jgi:Zn-dependent protease with chaperone function
MMWSVGWTLFSALLVASVAPRLARQLPPATATMLLVGSALATVFGCGYVTGALAFTWIAEIPEVAKEGDWSPLLLRHANPVPAAVAVLGGVAVVAGLALMLRAAQSRLRSYRQIRHSVAGLDHDHGLLIIDSSRPDAFATPAAGGRIVITTGLLEALQPGEHRVVIAHERAHLRLRHSWWIVAVDLAAAANPLIRPTARAAAESIERWADERAAATVGDRKLAARALARAALHVHNSRQAVALPMVGGQMPRRVSALLEPPPRRRFAPMAVWVALLLAVTVTTLNVETNADHMFDRATVSSTSPTSPTSSTR